MVLIFFFKQKTAYEMRISDWSSDVCSSDLIVGTGGDGAHTFNISTASMFVAAAAGCRIAKHGNRSVSSKSGSADVLEAFGAVIALTQEQVARCLEQTGIGRSAESRVGKECVRTCRSRWSPYH